MNGNPEPGRGPLEKAIAITGGDAAYFDLMRDCIASLQATEEGRSLALGVLGSLMLGLLLALVRRSLRQQRTAT